MLHHCSTLCIDRSISETPVVPTNGSPTYVRISFLRKSRSWRRRARQSALRLIHPHTVPKAITGCTSRRLDTERRTSRGPGPPGPQSCRCPGEQCRTRRSPRRGCRRSPCCSASSRALQKEASMLRTSLEITVQYGLEAAKRWG
jgi:hypothetical protein